MSILRYSLNCGRGGPVVYRLLRDCEKRAQEILQEVSCTTSVSSSTSCISNPASCSGARTLLELQESAQRFVSVLHHSILVPRDAVNEMDDLPAFLIQSIRRQVDNQKLSEEEIVSGFADWLDTSLPFYQDQGIQKEETEGTEYISFTELMYAWQSFARYHRGVRWGGPSSTVAGGLSYRLHPWHNTYCPTAQAEQMPYVHLLQWIRRLKTQHGSNEASSSIAHPTSANTGDPMHDHNKRVSFHPKGDKMHIRDPVSMHAWHATEIFSPPSLEEGFSVLDVGCHSGYALELLLKSGARVLVGADVAAQTIGNAEATVREHLQGRRSTARTGRMIQLLRCDLLPIAEQVGRAHAPRTFASRSSSSSSFSSIGTSRGKYASTKAEEENVGHVLASAAANRRRAGRQRKIPIGTEKDFDPSVQHGGTTFPVVSDEKEEVGPFDVLLFHPPPAPLLPSWPLRESLSDTHTFGLTGHPHSQLSVLRELLQRLLVDCTNPKSEAHIHEKKDESRVMKKTGLCDENSNNNNNSKTSTPIVKVGGYVAFILPRTFDPREILQHTSITTPQGVEATIPLMSLADIVTTTLEGSYALVLRRTHSLSGMLDTRGAALYLRAFADPSCRARIQRELEAFYQIHQTMDLIVLRKKASAHLSSSFSSSSSSAAFNSTHSFTRKDVLGNLNSDSPIENLVQHVAVGEEPILYEDSFEYTEYIPPNGPPLAHHWTELAPSYSYLEDDFFNHDDIQNRNFLAVGRTSADAPKVSPVAAPASMQSDEKAKWSRADGLMAEKNLLNYRSMFAAELRRRRRSGRVRKMALQPLERQEWFIDEKLVKSEAAKVDLINELSRFDMKDWD